MKRLLLASVILAGLALLANATWIENPTNNYPDSAARNYTWTGTVSSANSAVFTNFWSKRVSLQYVYYAGAPIPTNTFTIRMIWAGSTGDVVRQQVYGTNANLVWFVPNDGLFIETNAILQFLSTTSTPQTLYFRILK